jgi:hypothetical protein
MNQFHVPDVLKLVDGLVPYEALKGWFSAVSGQVAQNCGGFFFDSFAFCSILVRAQSFCLDTEPAMCAALVIGIIAFHLAMNERCKPECPPVERYFAKGQMVKEIGEQLLIDLHGMVCAEVGMNEERLTLWKKVVEFSEILFEAVKLENHMGIAMRAGFWGHRTQKWEEKLCMELMRFIYLASVVSFVFNDASIVARIHQYLMGTEDNADFLRCLNKEYLVVFMHGLKKIYGKNVLSEIVGLL